MTMDPESLYQALTSHDPRFDGRFFVGVSSTMIYCRPVCRAKTPKRASCTFYANAAAAEQAGYRPCLRCRPELAPGGGAVYVSVDASRRLAQTVAGRIEDGSLTDSSFGDLARRLEVSDRHLRRTFHAEYGVAPVEFLQTQRLLLAKRLLTDTRLPVTEVAMASGFASLRRFNTLFKERYRLRPSDLRKTRSAAETLLRTPDTLVFALSYRPPYAWDQMLDFLARRALSTVEMVAEGCYRRVVSVDHRGRLHTGWLEVSADAEKSQLRVMLASSLSSVIPQVLGRIKAMFDLGCLPEEIDARLGDLAKPRPGLRLPGAFDGFEMAVRAVLGQQITVKAAHTLLGRFSETFGVAVRTPFRALTKRFPTPGEIADVAPEVIGRLGIVRVRVSAILRIAALIQAGELELQAHADVERTIRTLKSIPGVGDWTAQYLAMRALSWPDAFPHTDFAVKKALRETDPRRVLARGAAWQPWRAYAVVHLWQSLQESTP